MAQVTEEHYCASLLAKLNAMLDECVDESGNKATQRQIAYTVGLDISTIRNIRAGSIPGLETVCQIADRLGFTIEFVR